MEAQRILVKVYFESTPPPEPTEFIPVFHRWIRARALDEVLIDVADYSHVDNGPGVLLICHAANYGIDRTDGRLGLAYSRKRDMPGTPEERLRSSFRSLLTACRQLEEDPALKERVRFSGKEFLLQINDRLLAPNVPETYVALEPELRRVAARLFGDTPFELSPSAAPHELFAVRIRVSGEAPRAATLLTRI